MVELGDRAGKTFGMAIYPLLVAFSRADYRGIIIDIIHDDEIEAAVKAKLNEDKE